MNAKAEAFGKLHVPGKPLILYNIWDAGSAAAVITAGAKAIATGSYGVANAHGFKDGETLPLEVVFANLTEIVSATDLPVTIDLEAGYGSTPEAVGEVAGQAAAKGAAGCNIEDKDPETRKLFETADAAARYSAAAQSGIWINARADLFIVTPPAEHDEGVADALLERAKAYADAGANSLFVPFVTNLALIGRICERSPLPVNILMSPGTPDHKTLADLGVARISHGHYPWAQAMADLEGYARQVFDLFG
jgi:2-methylisocitrate lyase-like PEP mutase family enzyme